MKTKEKEKGRENNQNIADKFRDQIMLTLLLFPNFICNINDNSSMSQDNLRMHDIL